MAAIKAKVDQATGAVESFLASAPIGVKASALAAGGAAQGGILGYVMGGLTKDLAKQVANAPQAPGMPPPPQMPVSRKEPHAHRDRPSTSAKALCN
jgi:hypothetical protein